MKMQSEDQPLKLDSLGDHLRADLVRVHGVCDSLCNRTKLPWRLSLANWYAKSILPSAPVPIRCPTVYGFDLVLDEATGGNVYRLGFYEAGTLDFMKRYLGPGDIFVDAGASIGLMSLFASFCVGESGRVLAFEPLARRYEQLVASVNLNERTNIRTFPFGLSNVATELSIFTDRASPSMVLERPSDTGERTRVERLDKVLDLEGLRTVNMIKVDVEGFELKVLEGCEKLLQGSNAPILCVEYGVYDGEACPLLYYLRSLKNYRLYQLRGTKKYVSRLAEIPADRPPRRGDNIFCLPRRFPTPAP